MTARLARRALVALVGAAICSLVAARGEAQGVSAEPWSTILTEHFSVHYHASVAEMAPDVARMCEQAHVVLSPYFPGAARDHTHVVLVDPVDAANGSASVLPRNEVVLQAMPPEAGSVLGDYDNWMWNLILHEYTHILHLDQMSWPIRWINTPLRPRFAPNQALPRWLIEGLATWQESLQTDTGRTSSSLFRMYLRAAALEGRIPDIGSLSGAPTCWPQATGWYLFGSFFVQWVAETRGADVWSEFAREYGRRPIPYAINVVARQTLGDDMISLWNRWRDVERARALAVAVVATASGAAPLEHVTTRGHRTRYVTADREGRVAWIRDDGHSPQAIVVRTGDTDVVVDVDDAGEVALVPGRDEVVISSAHLVGQGEVRRDLFFVPLDGGPWRQLTWNARARDPAIDPDAVQVAWVAPDNGRTDLWIAPLDASSEPRMLARAPAWGQYARPTFTPDGTAIVAMKQTPGQARGLVRIDVATGAETVLLGDDAIDADPWVMADDEHVLFSSDRAGRFELYALHLATGRVDVVARSVTGLFSPVVVEHDGRAWLYAATYDADGFDVARIPWSGVPDAVAPASYVRDVPALPPPPELAEARRYAPVRYLWPTRWGPNVAIAGDSSVAGLTASGSDPAGLHAWTLLADWSFERDTGVFAMTWLTSALPVGLSLNGGRTVERRESGLLLGSREVPYDEERWSAGVGTSVAFGQPRSAHVLSASFSFDWRDAVAWPGFELDPFDRAPRYPEYRRLHSLALGWGWSRVRSHAWSISPERGVSMSVNSRFRAEELGAQVSSAEVSGRVTGYVPMPWLEHHVVAVRATGALGTASGIGRRLYGVGGISPQDVISALIDQLPAPNGHIRGYAPSARVGDRYVLVNTEYRFPLFRLDAGIGTLPLFFRRMYGVVFVDVGNAAYDPLRPGDMLTGLGAELRTTATFGYFSGASFRLGLARGLGGEGQTDVYLLYGFDY